MFIKYVKLTVRNITRQKTYSIINISGLALGMAICLLLLLWVQDEVSYDKFHTNIKDIYQITMVDEKATPITGNRTIPYQLIPSLREKYSEVRNATRIKYAGNIKLQNEEKTFNEQNVIFGEPNLFEIFTFPILQGDLQTALNEPMSMIITESIAKKYFGNENPLNKSLLLNNKHSFNVTGIIKDIPENSSINFDIVVPFSLLGENANSWSWECQGYVQLHENISYDSVYDKFRTALIDCSPREVDQDMLLLQQFSRVHLYSSLDKPQGKIMVSVFSAIGIIILILACINFINLSTAKSVKRAREVGVRKVIGASRKQLISQFLFESLFISALAMILSLILLEFLLPEFNRIAYKNIIISPNNKLLLIGLPSILVFTGFISGIYPALFLSSYKPIKVLKTTFRSKSMKSFRKILVVFQFSISIILIIISFVMIRQLHFINNKDLGIEKEAIISIPLHNVYKEKFVTIKDELLKNEDILYVSNANCLPSSVGNINPASWEGKADEERVLFKCCYIEKDYLDLFDINVTKGTTFQMETAQHPDIEFIVNETAVKLMKMKDPIGKKFSMFGNDGYIVGVVKDFHHNSLSQEIEPVMLMQMDWFRQYLIIRLNPENIRNSLKFIETTIDKIAPGYEFQFTFMDEHINRMYRGIQRSRSILLYFTILAAFISSLGLFGLSMFITEQRSKEVSIRKVLGSSVSNVVLLLTSNFLKWVTISSLIASPIAYYFSSKFLDKFAYHMELSSLDFLIPIIVQFLIAIFAISYQTIKTATSNPVNALKYE